MATVRPDLAGVEVFTSETVWDALATREKLSQPALTGPFGELVANSYRPPSAEPAPPARAQAVAAG